MKTILLDFDDTTIDRALLDTLYLDALATLFVERLGGDFGDWRTVCLDVLWEMQEEFWAWFRPNPAAEYNAWMASAYSRSAEQILGRRGFDVPEQAEALARTMQAEALRRCNAAFPNVEEALQAWKAQGFALQMASGQDSDYLRAGLQGAGLSGWADIHFGPDLINCAKESALYYVRILEHLGSNPADLLVVDDDPLALDWAMALGCKGLQTKLGQKRDTPTVDGVSGVLTDWRDAPRWALEILGK